jgi:F0F1-type ATP synthase membrane subunit b/b'
VAEILKHSQPDKGAISFSLEEYQSKIEEILLKENDKFRQLAEQQAKAIIDEAQQKADSILAQSQKKSAENIGASEQKAAQIISDSYRKAEKTSNESQQKAQSEQDEILRRARKEAAETTDKANKEAQRILTEVQDNAKNEAKNRMKSEAEKILSRAREESDVILAAAREKASAIIAQGEKDAEKQALDTVDRLKKEADALIKIEIEKCSAEARVQSSQICDATRSDAHKMINNIMAKSQQVQVLITESVKNTESILAKARENIQAEMGDLARHIAEVKNSLEQITDSFVLEKGKIGNGMGMLEDLTSRKSSCLIVKAENPTLEIPENGDFQGKIEFNALEPYNVERIKYLKKSFTQVHSVKYLGESSSEEGILMSYELREKLPLLDILKRILTVEKVEKEGANLKLTLL